VNHWPFIIAAYGLTATATLVLLGWTLFAMLRAERAIQERAEQVVDERREK
jgi:hypothetical protein